MAHVISKHGLSHVSIGVRDLEISKTFYSAALAKLGLCLLYDGTSHPTSSQRTLGYGVELEREEIINVFEIGDKARPPGPGFHIALNATDPDAVTAFYKTALAHGGVGDGGPGYRQNYGNNYFAAFVRDPDGWKLEAVCQSHF